MPFLIQNLRHTHVRLNELETRTEPPKEEGANQDNIAGTYGNLGGFNNGMLMLENGGGMMPPPMPGNVAPGMVDMSGFASAQMTPGMVPNGGLMPPNGGMMPNGGGMPAPGIMPTM